MSAFDIMVSIWPSITGWSASKQIFTSNIKGLDRLLAMEIDLLVVIPCQYSNYKSGKKKLTVRIPSLIQAMKESVEELAMRDERL